MLMSEVPQWKSAPLRSRVLVEPEALYCVLKQLLPSNGSTQELPQHDSNNFDWDIKHNLKQIQPDQGTGLFRSFFIRDNSRTCLKRPLKKKTKIGFKDQILFNAGQKYCRMLQGELSAILLAFIKLPFVIKNFVLSIFEWPLKTGFTVLGCHYFDNVWVLQ